ncbi:MAG: hypothetical protein NTV19_17285, partial [Burkholderiales bacterium]|nr:hypothetical protein [Burkholderiales bacterium]
AILADYRRIGERLWERFNGGRDGVLWYYRALVDTYRAALLADEPAPDSPMGFLLAEIERTVESFEALAARDQAP